MRCQIESCFSRTGVTCLYRDLWQTGGDGHQRDMYSGDVVSAKPKGAAVEEQRWIIEALSPIESAHVRREDKRILVCTTDV